MTWFECDSLPRQTPGETAAIRTVWRTRDRARLSADFTGRPLLSALFARE